MNSKIYVMLITALHCFGLNQSIAQKTIDSNGDSTNVLSAPKKRWTVKIGAGVAAPSYYGGLWAQQAAPVVFVQPEYQLIKHLNLGLRFEYAFLTKYRASYASDGQNYGIVEASKMPSIALFLDYHFRPSSRAFDPFIGIGIGNFFRGTGNLISLPNPFTVSLGNSPGLIPRVGFSSKHISLIGEANILWENNGHGNFRAWWGNSGEFRGRNYLSIKLGYSL